MKKKMLALFLALTALMSSPCLSMGGRGSRGRRGGRGWRGRGRGWRGRGRGWGRGRGRGWGRGWRGRGWGWRSPYWRDYGYLAGATVWPAVWAARYNANYPNFLDSAGNCWWEVTNNTSSEVWLQAQNGPQIKLNPGESGQLGHPYGFRLMMQTPDGKSKSYSTRNHNINLEEDARGNIRISSWI